MYAMLQQSPFFDFLNRHEQAGFASYVNLHVENEHYINWNDYLLPNHYGDPELEYRAIRNSCAICDVTPLRKIRIHGNDAGAFLDRLVTRPVSTLPPMRATYTVFCNDDGSFKDDAIVYKFDEDDYLMMPSDIDHSPYFRSICDRFQIGDVVFNECTQAWAGAALQGPSSAAVLQKMGFDTVDQLQPFEIREYELGGGAISVARMGFTADLGYECWMSPLLVDAFCEAVATVRAELDLSIPGYALDAIQVCRLEGGFIVAGWDCSTEIDPQPGFERTPLELGLSWLVDFDGVDFVGKGALLEQRENGLEHVLRYFSTENRCQLQDGADLLAADSDTVIGRVNNSMWSWGLQKTIGNVSLLAEHRDCDTGRVHNDSAYVTLRFHRKPLMNLPQRNQVPAPLD